VCRKVPKELKKRADFLHDPRLTLTEYSNQVILTTYLVAFFIMHDLIRLVNVEKTSWNEHNGVPTFRPFYPFFESLRPLWTLKKLSDPHENLHSCLYLEKEHFPYRADINFQKTPFSTYPNGYITPKTLPLNYLFVAL